MFYCCLILPLTKLKACTKGIPDLSLRTCDWTITLILRNAINGKTFWCCFYLQEKNPRWPVWFMLQLVIILMIFFSRSLYKQLVTETSHEKFDERRVTLLKSQIIQLERQVRWFFGLFCSDSDYSIWLYKLTQTSILSLKMRH